MTQSPQEIILQSIETIKFFGLTLMLPKIRKQYGMEFVDGCNFFAFEDVPEVELTKRKLTGCDPLGAVIYTQSKTPGLRGVLSGLASYETAAKSLGVDYSWVRGFDVGLTFVDIDYVPGKKFNLRTAFDAEGFDFGNKLIKKLCKTQ